MEHETKTLESKKEIRFIVPEPTVTTNSPKYHLKLKKGTAELFGVPLLPNEEYFLPPNSYSIFTFYGCTIQIAKQCRKMYTLDLNDPTFNSTQIASVQGNLNLLRYKHLQNPQNVPIPRIAILGPPNSGKSGIAKTLLSYALRTDHSIIFADLNPGSPSLSPMVPGCLSTALFTSLNSLHPGTDPLPKGPLSQFYGFLNPAEQPELYQISVNNIAAAIEGKEKALEKEMRLETKDTGTTYGGLICDLFGLEEVEDADLEEKQYQLLLFVLKRLKVNIVLVLGLERIINDLNNDLETSGSSDDPTGVHVVKIPASGGVGKVEIRQSKKIKEYFEGNFKLRLSPFRRSVKFDEFEVFRVHDKVLISEAILPVGESGVVEPVNATKVSLGEIPVRTVLGMVYGGNGDVEKGNGLDVGGVCVLEEKDEEKGTMTLLFPSVVPWKGKVLVYGGIKYTEL
eukprot:maker-scaffold_1-snap-gene-6.3-mRNA-1 protein AED:0.07 eAED:0.07 QI:119/1/1/1/0.5/0.33/3/163/453